MKIFLSIAALTIVSVILVFVFLGRSETPAPSASTPTPPELPIVPTSNANGNGVWVAPAPTSSSSTSTAATLSGNDGASIVTRDFIHDPVTMPDPSNPGNYYLTGSSTEGFAIGYRLPAQFFTIALEREPLGATRIAAENFLMQSLGVSQQQMCNLQYYIGTDVKTSSLYAGKHLGFSFCPGAIPLPR